MEKWSSALTGVMSSHIFCYSSPDLDDKSAKVMKWTSIHNVPPAWYNWFFGNDSLVGWFGTIDIHWLALLFLLDSHSGLER